MLSTVIFQSGGGKQCQVEVMGAGTAMSVP